MDGVRAAAGFEGLIVLAVIYFVLNLISEGARKKGRSSVPPTDATDEPSPTQQEALSLEHILREIEKVKQQPTAQPRLPQAESRPLPAPKPKPKPLPPKRAPLPPRRAGPPPRKAQPAGDPQRGPLGRMAPRRLEEAEDVEERTSLEGASLEVAESLEILDETRLRPERRVEDFDDAAEGIVARRVKAAEARNQAHRATDHDAFHDRIAQGEIGDAGAARQPAAGARRSRGQQLRDAIIWREILGPPKGLTS